VSVLLLGQRFVVARQPVVVLPASAHGVVVEALVTQFQIELFRQVARLQVSRDFLWPAPLSIRFPESQSDASQAYV
jgi:hypothetical protein